VSTPEPEHYRQGNALTRWQAERREIARSALRTGQVKGWPNQSSWEKYVASWPSWRDPEYCRGACHCAGVCGRARVCVCDARVPGHVTYALARLSALVHERAPAPEPEYLT